MKVTREQAIQELQRRGVDISTIGKPIGVPEASASLTAGKFVGTPTTGVSKAMAYNALKERGFDDDTITKSLQPETKPSSFWKSLVDEIPEYGGALLGGLIGGAKGVGIGAPGGPVGMAVGGITGAALGGAAGIAAKQIGKQIGKDPTAPTTSLEAAKEIALAGGRQAAYEAGGRVVVGTIGKVLSPFGKTIKQEAKIAIETLEKYMPKKFTGRVPALLPAEATENRVLDILENIAEGSLVGGEKIAKYKNITRPEALGDMVDDLVKAFGEKAEPDLVGEAFTLAVEKGLKPSRLAATTLYNKVDDMTKNLSISIPVEKEVVSNVLDKAGNPLLTKVITTEKKGIISLKKLKEFAEPLSKIAKDVEGIEAKNAGDDLIQAIMALDNNVDFAVAKELRSRLISKVDEFSIINKKAPAIGKAKRAIALLDEATGQGLKEHSPEALTVWREANRLYREGSKQFDNNFIRGLIKQAVDKGNPEVIVKQIFKPNAISNIRRAKSAVDDKTWTELKSWYLQDVIKKSASPKGELSGQTFVNQLTGKTGMGDKALAEIFTSAELQSIKNVGTTLRLATQKQAEGVGRMWIQLTQAGAVIGLFDERSRPYSIALLGGPVVLARLFTNPIAAKWLIQGARLPANSPQAAAALTKLGGMALTIQREEEMKSKMRQPRLQPPSLPPDVEAYKKSVEIRNQDPLGIRRQVK